MLETKFKVIEIPAIKDAADKDNLENKKRKRVCAYCRVSTKDEGQLSSYGLQLKHYTEFITANKSWKFVGIYSDYGKSGTSTNKRVQFMQMIEDCKSGKVNFVIIKSVSRFSRNTVDCLKYVRMLKNLTPPVGIYFEKEKLNTLDDRNEVLLTLYSSMAQEEARSISENLTWGIKKRFEEGKAICPTRFLVGYDADEFGDLVINENEAKIIRRIYQLYMGGKGSETIARELKAEGVISARGGSNWGRNSIMNILKNERYCGAVVMQKSYTVDFLTHKRKVNEGELSKYYIENHHPGIIPRDEWNEVQDEIKKRHEMAVRKDRMFRQGYSNASVLSNRIFCGCCGQPLIRKPVTLRGGGVIEKISTYRCRATEAKACKKSGYKPCSARSMQERKIKDAFMEMLIQLNKNRKELECVEGNESLIKILGLIEHDADFKDEYFRELVEKGIVYNDGRIEYFFVNGFKCVSYINLDRKAS